MVIPAARTSISIPSPLLDVKIDRASKGYESALIQDADSLEPSPKIFGLLTAVEAWPGALCTCLERSTIVCRGVQPPLHWVPGLARSLAPKKHPVQLAAKLSCKNRQNVFYTAYM